MRGGGLDDGGGEERDDGAEHDGVAEQNGESERGGGGLESSSGREQLRCGGGVDVGLRCGGGGTIADGSTVVVVPWLATAHRRGRSSVGTAWQGQRQRGAAKW